MKQDSRGCLGHIVAFANSEDIEFTETYSFCFVALKCVTGEAWLTKPDPRGRIVGDECSVSGTNKIKPEKLSASQKPDINLLSNPNATLFRSKGALYSSMKHTRVPSGLMPWALHGAEAEFLLRNFKIEVRSRCDDLLQDTE